MDQVTDGMTRSSIREGRGIATMAVVTGGSDPGPHARAYNAEVDELLGQLWLRASVDCSSKQ